MERKLFILYYFISCPFGMHFEGNNEGKKVLLIIYWLCIRVWTGKGNVGKIVGHTYTFMSGVQLYQVA